MLFGPFGYIRKNCVVVHRLAHRLNRMIVGDNDLNVHRLAHRLKGVDGESVNTQRLYLLVDYKYHATSTHPRCRMK